MHEVKGPKPHKNEARAYARARRAFARACNRLHKNIPDVLWGGLWDLSTPRAKDAARRHHNARSRVEWFLR